MEYAGIRLVVVLFLGSAVLCHANRLADPFLASAERNLASEPRPAGAAGGIARETSDVIGFLNGDRLHGRLMGFAPGTHGLKWSRADVEGAIAFGVADVSHVNLAGRAERAAGPVSATVTLANKDAFGGSISGIDDKTVVVDAASMGRITVNRSMVKSIVLRGAGGAVLYEGPNDPSEWVFSTADYAGNKVDAGGLQIAYGLAEKKLAAYPELAEVRFTATWRYYPAITVLVLGETSSGSFSSGYSFMVQSSTVYINKFTRNSGSRQVASFNVEKLGRGVGSALFQIFIDQKKKVLTFMMDGEVLRSLTDTGEIPTGSSLVFSRTSGRSESTRISAIRVANWDGRVPVVDAGAASEAKEDIVRLKNGDKLTGKLEGVSEGKLSIITSFASLSIPLENAEEIVFSGVGREMPRRNKMDVRAMLKPSGCLTGDLGAIEGDTLRFRSESFGNVAIPLEALRKIEFNIYRDRPAASGESGSGAPPDVLFD